eukprot:scaffold234357_cov26-Tisochrysis_lutea.AAC.1
MCVCARSGALHIGGAPGAEGQYHPVCKVSVWHSGRIPGAGGPCQPGQQPHSAHPKHVEHVERPRQPPPCGPLGPHHHHLDCCRGAVQLARLLGMLLNEHAA